MMCIWTTIRYRVLAIATAAIFIFVPASSTPVAAVFAQDFGHNRFSKFTVFPIISNSLESIVNARIENKQLQRVVLHFQHL